MKIYNLILFVILVLFSSGLRSQSRDEQISKGIDYVYQLKFDSANAIFQILVDKDSKDPTGYFLQAMSLWWQVFVNKQDESRDDDYLSKVDKCIKLCDDKLDANENDDWVLFLKGGVIGYRGFLNSIRENWLRAVNDGKEGLSLLQRSYELNPANKDAVFGVGLYNYTADYAGERFPFLKPLMIFFPKGNKDLGLQQLQDCALNAKFAKTEAKYVLCHVNLIYEKNYAESEKYALELFKMYPQNPVFEKYLGRSYVGEAKFNESVLTWLDVLVKNDSGKVGFNTKYIRQEASYYLAVSDLNLGKDDDALRLYNETVNLCNELDKDKETAYKVFSLLGLGMINDRKGNRNDALKFYDNVLDMTEIDNSHQLAEYYKHNPFK